MGKRRRKSELDEVNLLDVIPVRVAEWTERGGRLIVTRPSPSRGGLTGMVDRLLYLLSARRIRLDEVGSFVWSKLDGSNTVGRVAAMLREEFGDMVEPAEERLGHLVRVFRREGLVAYRGWDEEELRRAQSPGALS